MRKECLTLPTLLEMAIFQQLSCCIPRKLLHLNRFYRRERLGIKAGWVEGLELNFLGLVTGLDLRHPGIKLPGFGRLGLPDGSALAAPARTRVQ